MCPAETFATLVHSKLFRCPIYLWSNHSSYYSPMQLQSLTDLPCLVTVAKIWLDNVCGRGWANIQFWMKAAHFRMWSLHRIRLWKHCVTDISPISRIQAEWWLLAYSGFGSQRQPADPHDWWGGGLSSKDHQPVHNSDRRPLLFWRWGDDSIKKCWQLLKSTNLYRPIRTFASVPSGCPKTNNTIRKCETKLNRFHGCMQHIFIDNEQLDIDIILQRQWGRYAELLLGTCGITDRWEISPNLLYLWSVGNELWVFRVRHRSFRAGAIHHLMVSVTHRLCKRSRRSYLIKPYPKALNK